MYANGLLERRMIDSRLDLDDVIRPTLARLEDSLIFDLFERSQFKTNKRIYTPGAFKIKGLGSKNVHDYFGISSPPDVSPSFFDFLFKETEKIHSLAGRFQHPQEYSFFDRLKKPLVEREFEESPLKFKGKNFNSKIKAAYLEAIPEFCETGDDDHYGSNVICDIKCLQDLSKRIHFGTYVAESKFQGDDQGYSKLIKNKDSVAIMEKLTNRAVEEKIFERVRQKGSRYNLNPDFIVNFYDKKIIPLTKEVEVDYLLRRLNYEK